VPAAPLPQDGHSLINYLRSAAENTCPRMVGTIILKGVGMIAHGSFILKPNFDLKRLGLSARQQIK